MSTRRWCRSLRKSAIRFSHSRADVVVARRLGDAQPPLVAGRRARVPQPLRDDGGAERDVGEVTPGRLGVLVLDDDADDLHHPGRAGPLRLVDDHAFDDALVDLFRGADSGQLAFISDCRHLASLTDLDMPGYGWIAPSIDGAGLECPASFGP